jgi:hypothetical protein
MRSPSLNAPRSSAAPKPVDRVARLRLLGPAGRLAQYRAGKLDLAELSAWAARYPDEAPTVNGEVEWIALTLADLD